MTIISSCSKDGEPGVAGKDGQTGTANVIYSSWTQRTYPAPSGGSSWQIQYAAPQITQEILDKGTILSFWKQDLATEDIAQLPLNTSVRIEVYYGINRIQHYASFNASGFYRYVILPGGISTSGRGITPPDYTKMSYHEICTKFNIPE